MPQADAQALIARMVERYPPPQHLRGQPKAQAAALADYEKALAPFDADTLEKGWAKVVSEHAFWVWPNPGSLAQACRDCAPKPAPASEEEQSRQKALDMTDAHVARYMRKSHLARLARQEGWEPRLREYVAAASWVQAQLLCGVRHIGWDATLARDLGRFHSSQEAFDAYCHTIQKAVKDGHIRVHVPKARIHEWKQQLPQQPAQTAAEANQPSRGGGR